MTKSAVVDRPARNRAAEILRQFASGRMTNDAFDAGCPDTADPGIHSIWSTCWVFYDDFKTHRLIDRYRLTHDQRTLVKRMVLFLDSDHPYQWPPLYLPGIDPHYRRSPGFWRALFSLNRLPPVEVDRFLAAGFYPVWPFSKKKDYLQALANPKRLSGKKVEA